MVGMVNGDFGVVYNKVTFCVMKCYTGVRVDSSTRLRKLLFLLCAKWACLNVDLGNQDEDTHL